PDGAEQQRSAGRSTPVGRRPAGVAQFRDSWANLVRPRSTGLPNWLVLCWFPLLLLLLLLAFVAFGISGSSTGNWWGYFESGPDPSLLRGTPRPIRSDEWLVQSSWVVSQIQQGFPVFNGTFPGGMDATVQNDLPVWEWSSLFRPHVVGFLLLPLDQGMAIRWWLPGLSLIAAAYVLLVTLLPRRPITSAALATVFFLSPLIQWWFLPTTIWPPTWAFLAMAAVIWALRDPRSWVRILFAAGTGYLAVTMVLGIYAPFIVPSVLVFGIFSVGVFVQYSRSSYLGLRVALIRLIPLAVAGVGAGLVVGLWVLTRRDTITALLGTVYPGQRLESTGALNSDGLISLLAGPFDESLLSGAGGVLGPNSSEAATPLLAGLFLLIPLTWITIRDWRVGRYLHWTTIACIAATGLMLAFLLLPGWDWLAHLIVIDRTTVGRARMALAILAILAIALLIRRLDRRDVTIPWSISWVTAGVAAGSLILVWAVLRSSSDPGLVNSTHWRVLSILFVVAVLFLTRRQVLLGVLCLSLVAIAIGANINPWYRGVFDLNDTTIGAQITAIDEQNPGSWVGIGGFAPTGLLVQSGVQAYNGVQTYPPTLMWQQIDPTGQYQDIWNRLANVNWAPGVGEPVPQNPARDQIQLTFDSCSDFAQQHVTYVLSDKPLEQACLTQLTDITTGPTEFHVYQVQP
ncbi:MAG: hypothetical protein ABWZ02_10470, partial [Nakamurella sp.]